MTFTIECEQESDGCLSSLRYWSFLVLLLMHTLLGATYLSRIARRTGLKTKELQFFQLVNHYSSFVIPVQ